METIFDFDITELEIEVFWGGIDLDKSQYLEDFKDDQDAINAHIYEILMFRGEYKKAKEYLDKIPDSKYKFFTLLNHDTTSWID